MNNKMEDLINEFETLSNDIGYFGDYTIKKRLQRLINKLKKMSEVG